MSVVYVNGVWTERAALRRVPHASSGALPVLIHPRPKSVALIGLGSGETLFGAAGRPETSELIDSIEIVVPQLDTLRQLTRRSALPGAERAPRGPARPPRLYRRKGVHTERREEVRRDRGRRPAAASAYSGNLYSLEYFDLLRRHLSAGGLVVTWAPTSRTRATFLAVFPHVLGFGDVLIGSETPIAFDRAVIHERLADPFTRAYYLRGGIEDEVEVRKVLAVGPTLYEAGVGQPAAKDVNTDLFPKDEYAVPQSFRE